MTRPIVQFNDDDMFILGNIAALAIRSGAGEAGLPLLRCVQKERPGNAAAFIMESLYLHSIGKTVSAIEFLENSNAFSAEKNSDEALAFHLMLLHEDKQFNRVIHLGEAYLSEGLLESEVAINTVNILIENCHSVLSGQENGPDAQYAAGEQS